MFGGTYVWGMDVPIAAAIVDEGKGGDYVCLEWNELILRRTARLSLVIEHTYAALARVLVSIGIWVRDAIVSFSHSIGVEGFLRKGR